MSLTIHDSKQLERIADALEALAKTHARNEWFNIQEEKE